MSHNGFPNPTSINRTASRQNTQVNPFRDMQKTKGSPFGEAAMLLLKSRNVSTFLVGEAAMFSLLSPLYKPISMLGYQIREAAL